MAKESNENKAVLQEEGNHITHAHEKSLHPPGHRGYGLAWEIRDSFNVVKACNLYPWCG
jgi:hypothetical protein